MIYCGISDFPHYNQKTMMYQYVPSSSQMHKIYFLSEMIHETPLPLHAIQCMLLQDQGKNREEKLCICYLNELHI